ncbi:deaminase [Deltaproteobacteria bacterium]|nr:deaminase [Deltaproteobacteria bacterium]
MPRPLGSVFIATSLDGYIARADGGLDWLEVVNQPGEDYGFAAFSAGIDTMLIGRGTWDSCLAFPEWPYEGKRVVVLTHRDTAADHGELLRAGPVADVFDELATMGAKRVYVDGGVVIRQCLAAGLVQDLTISVIPVILGDGIRLFDSGLPETALQLIESRSWPSGLVQVRYEVRG